MNLEALSGPQFFCRVKLPWNLLFLSACVCVMGGESASIIKGFLVERVAPKYEEFNHQL